MSWDSEEAHDAKERAVGAAVERARIKKAQAGALRNLRVLVGTCSADIGVADCADGKHGEDCEITIVREAIRWLRAATKPEAGR